MDNNEEEKWKDVKGFEGKYQVSNQGRVRSIERQIINRRGRKQMIKEVIKRPDYSPNGYERVSLYKMGKGRHYRVAKLVYEAFVGPIPEGMEIDHCNGENTDNRLCNIRAVSHRENCNNPITRERHKAANESRSRKMKEFWKKRKAQIVIYDLQE